MTRTMLIAATTLAALFAGSVAATAAPAAGPVEVRKESHCGGSSYNVYVNGNPLFLYPQVQCPQYD